MSATGHQLRRRKRGSERVMELLGENPDLAEVSARFKLGALSNKDDLLARLQSRSDVDGIAVQLELHPVRQLTVAVKAKAPTELVEVDSAQEPAAETGRPPAPVVAKNKNGTTKKGKR